MSLLNALHDEKLGLLIPVMVRMEHKMDQLMALMGEMGSQLNAIMIKSQSNASTMGNQSNASLIGNQSNTMMMGSQSNSSIIANQSNAAIMGNQSNTTVMGKQSSTTVIANQSNTTMGSQSNAIVGNQSNAATGCQSNAIIRNQSNTARESQSIAILGNQSNAAMGSQSNVTFVENQSNAAIQTPSDVSMIASQSNTTAMETHFSSSTLEIQSNANTTSELNMNESITENNDNMMEFDSGVETAISTPGLVETRSQRGKNQSDMTKTTEQVLPDDLNLPLSRELLFALKAKSNSTMNFAVKLLRELFTMEELQGKNISGSRGKDQVDPKRVQLIREMVFKAYSTVPSDRDNVWRYCRKAMDSFLRGMRQRERWQRERSLNENAAALENADQTLSEKQS